MKKKISIMIVVAFSMILISCGTLKTDYTVSELGRALNKTNSEFKKATKDLSEDELYTEEAFKIYKKCSRRNDLPVNEKITISGKMKYTGDFFHLETSDDKYSVACFESKNTYSKRIFIDDGEDVTVSGVFSKDKESYGVLTDAVITAPEEIKATYGSNIGEVIKNANAVNKNVLEVGKVESIMSTGEFIEMMTTAGVNMNTYSGSDDMKVICFIPEDGTTGFAFVRYLDQACDDLAIGDKIAVRGDVDVLYEMLSADGSKTPMYIATNFIDNIYKF